MSEALEESKRLTVLLHARLDEEEKNGDDAEADRIRDLLDPLWHKMTDGERQQLRDFSVKLYEEKENVDGGKGAAGDTTNDPGQP